MSVDGGEDIGHGKPPVADHVPDPQHLFRPKPGHLTLKPSQPTRFDLSAAKHAAHCTEVSLARHTYTLDWQAKDMGGMDAQPRGTETTEQENGDWRAVRFRLNPTPLSSSSPPPFTPIICMPWLAHLSGLWGQVDFTWPFLAIKTPRSEVLLRALGQKRSP